MEFSGAMIGSLINIPALATAGEFSLHRVNLVRAGCPVSLLSTQPNQIVGMPIVIAHNRNKHGYVASTDYYPKAIVVAGADKRTKLLADSVLSSWAWVEAGAMEINADDAMSSNELMQKITAQLVERYVGRATGLPFQETPWIVELYPFENYTIFTFKGQKYRQSYTINNIDRTVKLTGVAVKVEEKFVNVTACIEVMPRSQTGARYSFAPVHGNQQTSTMGAPNSELVMMIVRDWTNINEAADMYVDATQHGLYTPMTPAFAPVNLPKDGKITTALASRGIAPADFAIWSEQAQKKATKVKDGKEIPRKKFAYIGNPKDPSTWKLPIDTPEHARNALARINQTHDIPTDKKAGVLQRIRKAAKRKAIEVSEKATPKQKGWINKGKAFGDSAGMGY